MTWTCSAFSSCALLDPTDSQPRPQVSKYSGSSRAGQLAATTAIRHQSASTRVFLKRVTLRVRRDGAALAATFFFAPAVLAATRFLALSLPFVFCGTSLDSAALRAAGFFLNGGLRAERGPLACGDAANSSAPASSRVNSVLHCGHLM